jgi:ribonuclease J
MLSSSHNIKFEPHKTYYIPLGGSSEIGRNMYLLGHNNKWIVMDLGVSFNKDFGIEITMADISYLDNKEIVAIVITHGHEDHIGGIPYLIDQINAPIYATKFTADLILEKINDQQKLAHHNVDVRVVKQGEKFVIADTFEIEYIPITHSILEASMVLVKTPTVSFLNTGDWKFDPEPCTGLVSDTVRLAQIGQEGLDYLLCDSTNVVTEKASGSEREVSDSLKKVVAQYPNKRIIFTGFASNIARLQSCITAAKSHKRKVFIEGKALKRMVTIAQNNGYLESDDISPGSYETFPLEKTFLVCTGCQGESTAFLRRMVRNNKIEKGKDVVIFSSRAIPCNTQDITDLKNMLIERGADVLCSSDPTFFEEKEKNINNDHQFKGAFFSVKDLKLHVSGHASSEEIYELLKLVKPGCLIPGYGDPYHMYYMEKLANSVKQKYHNSSNGSVFLLEKNHIRMLGKIPVPVIGIDGNKLVDLNANHIIQRKKLSTDGIAVLTFPKKGEKGINVKNLKFTVLGLAYNTDMINDIIRELKKFITSLNTKPQRTGESNEAGEVTQFLQSLLLELTGKTPTIIIHQI